MADFILTYTKTIFYPLEPRKEDINIKDIAHSLSLMTRANGHFTHFYSVAQHTLSCYKEAEGRGYSKRVQLGCLLHDVSESYISDLTRPVKRNLPEYFNIEEKLQRMIYDRYGSFDITNEELSQINEVDDVLLHFEFEALMDYRILDTPPCKTMEHDFSQQDFNSVEAKFINVFNKLTREKKGYSCVGVDGCKNGWVAVNLTNDGFQVEVFKSIEEICSKYEGSDSIIIDMPIGLPEGEEDIRPEALARRVLASRASCIFNVPCRQAVYTEEYSEANTINRKVLGKGLSKQSHAICNKIKEIDQLINRLPKYKNKILEGHPEICFAMLNSKEVIKKPIYENKKTEEGIRKRIELLSLYYDNAEDIISYVKDNSILRRYIDDVIDALCLAVTGMVSLEKGLKSIPETPMVDSRGIIMQMVYATSYNDCM